MFHLFENSLNVKMIDSKILIDKEIGFSLTKLFFQYSYCTVCYLFTSAFLIFIFFPQRCSIADSPLVLY